MAKLNQKALAKSVKSEGAKSQTKKQNQKNGGGGNPKANLSLSNKSKSAISKAKDNNTSISAVPGFNKKKKQRPVKKAVKVDNLKASEAMANGEVAKAEMERKMEMDKRTLYFKFNNDKYPQTHDDIKAIHSGIKYVRTPRNSVKGRAKDDPVYKFCFVEFTSEEDAVKAKNELATSRPSNYELLVDFVGEKSRKVGTGSNKASLPNNPRRLFVCGLAPGVTNGLLKKMFPKSASAEIPPRSKKKGSSYGFVQFATPADAKAAFDASQNLEVAGHKITVLYAKMTPQREEVIEKKAKKRKLKEKEKIAEKKKKKQEELEQRIKKDEESEDEEDDDKDNDEDDKEDDNDNDEDGDDNDEDDDNDDDDDENDNEDEDDDNDNNEDGDGDDDDDDNDNDDDDHDDDDNDDDDNESD